MFVRFRKVPNSGYRPKAIADGQAKVECKGVNYCRGTRCRVRPRCRWVVGQTEQRLRPYRFKVSLVENRRVHGKVKQELIVTLGSIDAVLLDYFYRDLSPDVVGQLRDSNWQHHSLAARAFFWKGVLSRMSAIGDNRLSADERKSIRRAIHKVIPWVMEAEHNKLALLDAQRDFELWQMKQDMTAGAVDRTTALLEETARDLKELESLSAKEAEVVLQAGLRIAKLRAKR